MRHRGPWPCPLPVARSSPLATVLAIALCGCFADPPLGSSSDASEDGGSSSADDDTDAATTDTGNPGTATQGSASVSSTSATDPDAGSSSEATTSDPETTTDGPGPCGELGQPCCPVEKSCDQGQCYEDTCVAFRGAFTDPLPCGGCEAGDHLPTLSGCDCDGFPQSAAFSIDTDTCMQELPSVPADLFVCAAPLDPQASGSDWGGAHMVVVESECGDTADPCVVPNQYTGACECPPNMDAITAELTGPCTGGGPTASYRLVVCSSSAVSPITFGGAYQALDDSTCAEGNPRVGGICGCPLDFDPQTLRIISSTTGFGSTLVFCVGTP